MIDDGKRWLSSNGWEKGKLLGISALLALLVIWLTVNVARALWPEPVTRPLETPGWNLVQQLNDSLLVEPAFADTAFIVESESPLRLKLVGAVEAEEDLDDLEAFVAKLRPENDYKIEVELLHEITNSQPPPEGSGPDAGGDPAPEPDTGE